VLAIYCILRWCWFLDRPAKRKTTDIGGGIRVPNSVAGPTSHGWWAMVIVLIVGGMVCLLAGFSYVFLWSRRPDLWQAPPDIGSLAVVLGMLMVAGAGAVAAPRILRRGGARAATGATVLLALAAGAVLAATLVDGQAWWATGLRPDASSQGATVYALWAWGATFAAICGLMGAYVVLRRLFGLIAPERPSTVDLIGLFVAFAAAQGAGIVLLTRLFPGAS